MTDSDNEPLSPDHEEKIDWRYLRRRFFSVRSLVWVGVILVIAFALNHLSPNPTTDMEQPAPDHEVATPTDTSADTVTDDQETPSMSAVPSSRPSEP